MNAAELAKELTGQEYPWDVPKELAERAKDAGLVIVFGASDDLMEFRGAIHDELDCYDGGTAYLRAGGLLQNDCNNDDCPHFQKLKKQAATIEALWCTEGDYSWTYNTAIPHASFEALKGGAPYCRGIVFALADIRG